MTTDNNEAKVETDELEEEEVEESTTDTKETAVEDEKVQGNGEESDEDDENPLEVYKKAILEVESERLRREAREEVQTQRNAELQQAQLAQKQEQLKNHFGDTVKLTRRVAEENLKPLLHDEDGNPVPFSDELFQKIVKPWSDYNSQVSEAEALLVYTELAQAAIETLPEVARAEFNTKAANKPLKDYIKIHAELAAPDTEYVKQLKQSHDLAIKAARADAAARALRNNSKGTPPASPTSEIRKPTETIPTDTLVNAAKALVSGQITPERYAEIHNKMRNS